MKKATSMDDIMQNYRVLLSVEEENKLFDLWTTTRDNTVLLNIIQAYSPIIQRCIREVSGYKANPEDLRSEGTVALIEAARGFDRTRGRFSTYAKRCVKGIMLSYIIKNYFPINVCTSHGKKKLFYAIRKMIAIALVKEGKFDMTRNIAVQLSNEHKVEERVVMGIYDMIRKPHISISDKYPGYGSNSEDTIEDHLCSTDEDIDIAAELSDMEFHSTLIHTAMNAVLDDREKRIFTSQVLVHRGDRVILERLGTEFDISKERVRQLRNTAYEKVKDALINSIGVSPNIF